MKRDVRMSDVLVTRRAMVAKIQSDIANGNYDTQDKTKIDSVVDKLHTHVFGIRRFPKR